MAGLVEDIVNYSKLARQISKELKISNTDAILVACRRYASSLRKQKMENPVELIKKSRKSIIIEKNQAKITLTINERNLAQVLAMLK